MNYKCGHKACDICGGNEGQHRLTTHGQLMACESCVRRAVEFAYHAACTWAVGEIDPAKPCGYCRTPKEQP